MSQSSAEYCPVCMQQYDEGLCGCDLAKQLIKDMQTQEEREKEQEDERRDKSDS